MFDDLSLDLSIVVPVYNSAGTLDELAARLTAVLSRVDATYEIILVDDGSEDGSWNVLSRLQAADPQHVTAIPLTRNFGQCNAVMCGFRHSRGRYVVTLDDDLQNPPEEIPKLIQQIRRNDGDVVYGVYAETRQNLWRRAGSWAATKFSQRVFGCRGSVTSFRILKREVVDAILNYGLSFTYIDGLIAWNTQRIGHVEVAHHPRKRGASGYSLAKLLLVTLNLLTNFSLMPLQIVSLCGAFTAFGGLLTGGYYLVRYLAEGAGVPGHVVTMILVLVIGGLQMLSIGVLGEYVGRLHLNVNRKPQYNERQVLAHGGQRRGRGPPPRIASCQFPRPRRQWRLSSNAAAGARL